ncbi:AI-2E family transporter [Thermodesulfobacteriota bacterium]
MLTIKQEPQASKILITIAAFVIVIAGMSAAKAILVPFLLGIFISIISAPLLFWLQRKGLPQWLALLTVILGVLLIGVLLVVLVGSSIKDFTGNLPAYEARIRQQTVTAIAWLEKIGLDTSDLELTRVFDPSVIMKLTANLLNGLGNVLAGGFLILMIVVFILLEAAGFPSKLKKMLGGKKSSQIGFHVFIDNVKQYMAIKTIISLITGTLVFIILGIVGVDYPVLWGLLAFALNYVPNIGSIIAAVPVVLLTVIQIDLVSAIIVAIGYLVINLVMGSVIEPRFMGRGLGLSTLVVFLSLLFWGWVLGPVGMLLSVPLTITVKIALDSRDDSRWLAVLLGPETTAPVKDKPDGTTASENEISGRI